MKVLVIGSTGVVGRQLVPRLVADRHDVVTTSRSVLHDVVPGMGDDHRRLDLLDHAAVVDRVRSSQPEAIVHLATALSGLGNNLRWFDHAFALTNRLRTEGAASLLAAARHVADRPRVIVQSFCGWPWAPTGGPVKSEDDPLDPDPPRPSDARSRPSCTSSDSSPPTNPVSCCGSRRCTGPARSLSTGGVQVEAVRARRFPLFGNAGGTWSFLHVADAASAVASALPAATGVYNITDDRATVAEWLLELARVLGVPPPRRLPLWLGRLVGGEALVRLMTGVRGSDNRKARRELGWVPQHPSWPQGFAADLRTLVPDRNGGAR